jgi:RNA polymerase sigma factor (TIGR02999 family)
MADAGQTQITQLLDAANRGDRVAVDRLLPLVYQELRALAGSFFGRQRPDHTLQPTALVHEAYLRLADQTNPLWQDRRHFFNVAAMAMRQLLTDHARRQKSLKHGGGLARVTLDEAIAPSSLGEIDLVALDEALSKLAELDERQSRIVEIRFLAGLTVEETADVLGVSPRTVKLDWQMAKAWLRRELKGAAAE